MSPENEPGDIFGVIVLLLIYGLPVIGLIVFGFIGASVERRHYASIREREAATARLPAYPGRTLDAGRTVTGSTFLAAEVVITHDYFKRFIAGLKNFFGGRIHSYETLMDRARREAVLRLKEQAVGSNVIANLRLETCAIAKANGKKSMVAVVVIAYGTAVRYAPELPVSAASAA